jgi:hypothetical protein
LGRWCFFATLLESLDGHRSWPLGRPRYRLFSLRTTSNDWLASRNGPLFALTPFDDGGQASQWDLQKERNNRKRREREMKKMR